MTRSLPAAANSGQYVRDRLVVVDQPAVDESVHGGGDDAFRRREAHGHRVGLPRRAGRVAGPGPGVDDELAAVEHGHGGTATALVGRHAAQRLGDAAEVGMHEARDHGGNRVAAVTGRRTPPAGYR